MADQRGFSTKAVHAGEARRKAGHAVVTPVFLSSTFTFDDTADLVEFMQGRKRKETDGRCDYARYGNPTVLAAERKLAELEGGDAAVLFSSGMAAVTLTLLTFLSSGAHVVLTADTYRRTREFLLSFLKPYGVESTKVAVGDYDALERAIRPETQVILSESPTNPYLRVADLPRIAAIAREHGLHTIIDSTFGTPVNVRPLESGIDLVMHSCTKYLGGHNDLMAGVVVGSDELIRQVRETQDIIGAICDPHSAFLLARGLKTLALRVARQNESGMRVAQFLSDHPLVRQVHYPGLPNHPDHAVAKQQLDGYGGVVSFELAGGLEATARFIDALELPYIGPSLGATESLVGQVALTSYYDLTPEERMEIGISEGLVRLALGVEDVDDIIADLSQALSSM
jgi:cystathionine gamma-synthase